MLRNYDCMKHLSILKKKLGVWGVEWVISASGIDSTLTPAGCGGELFGPHGNFTSPGYPDRYPGNRECLWYIQTADETSITLTIYEFDVEYHPDCNYDMLEVRPSQQS